VSSWSFGRDPSGAAGAVHASRNTESGPQANGVAIGVFAVIGVRVTCSNFGESTSTERSSRSDAQPSTGWPALRPGSNVHRANDFWASEETDGIGSRTRRAVTVFPFGSTRIATSIEAVVIAFAATGLTGGSAGESTAEAKGFSGGRLEIEITGGSDSRRGGAVGTGRGPRPAAAGVGVGFAPEGTTVDSGSGVAAGLAV